MAKQEGNKEGLRKTGTSRRSRAGRAGKGGTMPRIMILALLIIVAGGAALFWPRGGGVPTGIGEHQTVVSTPTDSQTVTTPPRSGDVDINAEAATQLTPEKAEGAATSVAESKPAESKPVESKPVETKTTEPKTTEPKTTETKTTQPKTVKTETPPAQTQPRIQPQSEGAWVVQVGAFGQAENADREAARLKGKGWDARVRAGNNSSGDMVFRVWIGYFASRQEAQNFINQNSKQLSGAIPVHR